MLDRGPSRRLSLAFLAAVALLAPSPGIAADAPPVPVSDNLLDRPIVDVALVPRSGDEPADLLTVGTDGETPGTVSVSLIRRDGAWTVIAEASFALGTTTGASVPWLVELGGGRYAVLSADPDAGSTTIAAVSITGGSEARQLLLENIVADDLDVTDAGAADVEGDGTAELVLAGGVPAVEGMVCQGTRLDIFDGSSLIRRSTNRLPDVQVEGAAIGEFDGLLGDDLLAYASTFEDCSATQIPNRLVGLHAMRLLDGSAIADLPRYQPGGAPGVPLAFDLDGDGRDEALVRDGPQLVMVDPSRGWATTTVGAPNSVGLLAAPNAPPDAVGGRLAWFDPNEAVSGVVVTMAGVVRAPSGEFVVDPTSSLELTGGPNRGDLGHKGMLEAADRQQAPQVWRGDIDGDGCPEVLSPLVTAECDGQQSLRAGALWLATRPLSTFDVGPNRELLVAATMDWDPAAGRPFAPTPSAAGAPGAWRHGPSVGFVLSELRAGDATYFAPYPIPRPTIDRIAARDGATNVPGFTGSRVMVRSVTTRLKDRRPPVAPPLPEFLGADIAPGERVSISRIAVPSGAEAGRDGSFVRVPLPDILTGEAGPVEGWAVTITQLNDWGEIAPPVVGTVTRDTTGPSLSLEVPFTSAPWPLLASLRGRSEPGVQVSVRGGAPVEADRLGRFVIGTSLAPWPQTVEVTAVDPSGNATTAEISVIGGVDYRQFPWPAIVATLILVGALVGAVRSGKGPKVRELSPRLDDDEPFPEIEDLPSGTRF